MKLFYATDQNRAAPLAGQTSPHAPQKAAQFHDLRLLCRIAQLGTATPEHRKQNDIFRRAHTRIWQFHDLFPSPLHRTADFSIFLHYGRTEFLKRCHMVIHRPGPDRTPSRQADASLLVPAKHTSKKQYRSPDFSCRFPTNLTPVRRCGMYDQPAAVPCHVCSDLF